MLSLDMIADIERVRGYMRTRIISVTTYTLRSHRMVFVSGVRRGKDLVKCTQHAHTNVHILRANKIISQIIRSDGCIIVCRCACTDYIYNVEMEVGRKARGRKTPRDGGNISQMYVCMRWCPRGLCRVFMCVAVRVTPHLACSC